ncbi:hypothetical protein BH10PSE12_BH10PSE12_27600 [soil metagenome]
MTNRLLVAAIFTALTLAGHAAPAQAETIVVEGNGVRAQGEWGGELGAGYTFGKAGFALRPIAGAYFKDSGTKIYGKVEATYTIPLSAEIGAGARFSGDKTRLYGTASMPLLPGIRLKGNLGSHYYAVGLRAGF